MTSRTKTSFYRVRHLEFGFFITLDDNIYRIHSKRVNILYIHIRKNNLLCAFASKAVLLFHITSNEVSSHLAFRFRTKGSKQIFKMATLAAIWDFQSELF